MLLPISLEPSFVAANRASALASEMVSTKAATEDWADLATPVTLPRKP